METSDTTDLKLHVFCHGNTDGTENFTIAIAMVRICTNHFHFKNHRDLYPYCRGLCPHRLPEQSEKYKDSKREASVN